MAFFIIEQKEWGELVDVFTYFLIYLTAINGILYSLMGVDKSRARKRKQRIPEKQLWGFAILGGALGGSLGMRHFRHKTKHPSFLYGFPFLVLLQAILVGYLVLKLYTP